MLFFRSSNASVATFSSLSPLFKPDTKEAALKCYGSDCDTLSHLSAQDSRSKAPVYTLFSSKATTAEKKENKEHAHSKVALDRLRIANGSPMLQMNFA